MCGTCTADSHFFLVGMDGMEVEYAAEWAAKEQATSLATDMTELQTQTVLCSPSHIYIYIYNYHLPSLESLV